ncbi:DNA/RNA polymerase [Metschnikowia bicuspidata]|uniref:DNA polymerase n=1 Tax=Metschnikowia bicuspidata TaxID=27322 RepID=A0A4P9ZES8_9ASCO|nr:DNA/RNA polymerase [Metschnikowia bicuspidata]
MLLKVRISDLDSYQLTPTHLDQFQQAPKVPVIRVYGALKTALEASYNVLVHVHNYYPYLYIDCPERDPRRVDTEYEQRILRYLDGCLAESFNDSEPFSTQFAASVARCRACAVYGYNLGYLLVLKVLLFLPLYKARLLKLLTEKKIDFLSFISASNSERKRQRPVPHVYEAHINYYSQFLADFNLYGCGWLEITDPYIRSPILNFTTNATERLERDLKEIVVHNNVLNPKTYPRMSRSLLELDIHVGNISNRARLKQRDVHNDFSEFFSPTPLLTICLSSLRLTFDDLKFQCEVRGRSDTSQVLNKRYSQVFSKLGQRGYADWEFAHEQKEQLAHASKLNKPSKFSLPHLFYNNMIAHKLAPASIPTAFELVDQSMPINFYENVPKTNYKKDLIKWNSFDELFESILNQTQRAKPQHVVTSLFDSASTLSQTCHYLLRNPKQIFERLLPAQLSKKAFQHVFAQYGILEHDYADPAYYSKSDMHDKALVFANRKIEVPLKDPSTLLNISSTGFLLKHEPRPFQLRPPGERSSWQYVRTLPTASQVSQWIKTDLERLTYKRQKFRTQIEPALTQTYDFKDSHEPQRICRSPSDFPNLTQLHMELHVNVSGELRPDPLKDEVSMIVFSFDDSNGMFDETTVMPHILISASGLSGKYNPQVHTKRLGIFLGAKVTVYGSERDMVEQFCNLVDLYDSDILSGYEVNSSSWGYLIERFRLAFNINLMARLSRVSFKGNGKFGDRWGYTHTSLIKISGRHILNVWRVLRLELALTSYSLENVCFHVLHHTLPKFSHQTLSEWFQSDKFSEVLIVCKYYKQIVEVSMRIVQVKELIWKNVELSRVIGIDFYSNFYRGSQFKVESILIRIAKPENLLLNSPSKRQVNNMKPLEVIPLIMEPESGFYKSPLVVLDFQSLYPSIMIAYNYCYSTLLGKIEGFQPNRNPVGYMSHHPLPDGILEILRINDGINISPNGLMFVSAKFRKSILSRMLQEILNMRINVKTVAELFSDEKEFQKVYNSKQLALKLIVNVTYGYTSASFSGRMPSSDIADAIVATGREIMQKAIDVIDSSGVNAKVVYGDTDSLFVYFPGKSKNDAFKYGRELARKVTEVFPDPIKLKFEKVYHPCVLLAKKRYVGNCFESEAQKASMFEAKGIETIRRDGVPAQLKMVGKSLRILFESKNLSSVRKYVVQQFQKIFQNRVNVSDFCFSKEVRHGQYRNEKYLPSGAVIAKRLVKADARREPQYRERVPYLVVQDSHKERVKDRSVTPEEYVKSFKTNSPMLLDHEYYISRVLIPPLERIFNLIGVNVKDWYQDMPRTTRNATSRKNDVFYVGENISRSECVNCCHLLQGQKWVCSNCIDYRPTIAANVAWQEKAAEQNQRQLLALCQSCCFQNLSSLMPVLFCHNHDCRVYYSRLKAKKKPNLLQDKTHILDDMVDIEELA